MSDAKTYAGNLCGVRHDDGTGHSTRYLSTRGCVECQRLYQKGYRRKVVPRGRPAAARVIPPPAPAEIRAQGLLFRPSEWLPRNLAMIRRRSHPADRESYLNGVEIVWGFETRAELEAALTITEAMSA